MRRWGLDILLSTWLWWLALGFAQGVTAICLQIQNPTYAILSLEHYRTYYAFYQLGPRLALLAGLAQLASVLLLLGFVDWAADRARLQEPGESWPRRSQSFFSLLWLGLWAQAGLAWLTWVSLVMEHRIAPALAALAVVGPWWWWRSDPPTRWAVGLLTVTGSLSAQAALAAGREASAIDYLVPPLLSTHYGPGGILLWVLLLFACLGLGLGVTLWALFPDENCLPDSLHPIDSRRFRAAALVSAGMVAGLLASYPLYFVPRYQIGQDLRTLLLLKPSSVPGRTVVWLDRHSPAHPLGESLSWSNPANLKRVKQWLTTAPSPSALTRPATRVLVDAALFEWRPEDGLDWLEVMRRRQRFSNLNRASLVILRSTKPGPRLSRHLEALTDPARFAWPGAGSRLELAELLARYGRQEQARQWLTGAAQLMTAPPTSALAAPPSGRLRGQLMLDGRPLAGVRVALFRGRQADELVARTRLHVEGEAALIGQPSAFRPSYYAYPDLARLCDFYAVESTDEQGRFLFEPVDSGLYRLAVRLPAPASLAGSGGLVELEVGQDRDLGLFRLDTIR